MAPRLVAVEDGALLTWLEPAGGGHRLLCARLDVERGTWGDRTTITEGEAFFANWADVPGAVADGAGSLVAHWLAKLGADTYAYGVRMARSTDGGASWQDAGLLHDDTSLTEHGFVSYAALPEPRAFWLDGREMLAGGSMQLRTVALGSGTPGASGVLDDRVCECCATDAALTSAGPIVVYRDRSSDEVRDVAYVRATSAGFTDPTLVHADGWHVSGCPVNGPAVAADGALVVVAWFTGAADTPRVLAAFSDDAGATFAPPLVIDDERPLGRVDVASEGTDGAVVSWIAARDPAAEIRLQRVGPEGLRGPPHRVATTTPVRSAGVPTLLRHGDHWVLAWVEDSQPSQVRAARVTIKET